MEIGIIILIIAAVLLLVSKRFHNLVRNDFYLDKPDMQKQSKLKTDDKVHFRWDDRNRRIEVFAGGSKIGLVPEDYMRIVSRKLKEQEEAEGKIVAINKSGYKVHLDMKGEVRDIVK
ncbi:MAG: hypothetical protein K9G67_15970 [Bacteroidales bacterium]|nr:hypothetical protein [Bacteroidales bacterium]MCF8377853.1 hypothetical protein [Bacteroidales bacterium]